MNYWLSDIQQQLSRQFVDDRLPHALLISGGEGAGKNQLAQWLCEIILCQSVASQIAANQPIVRLQACGQCKTCQLHQKYNYPDHLVIASEKNTIGVSQIRQMNHFLEKKPHLGIAQTIIIADAENMTISAANALLKTLEEPTENSYIILITDQVDTLLPTVISRCQNINIRPPVGQSLLEHFGHNGDDKFVNLSHYQELSDAQSAQVATKFTESAQQFLLFSKQRTTLLTLLLEQKSAFRWLEKIIVDLMRAQHGWHEQKAVNSAINESALWEVYTLVQSANKQIKTLVQANKQYVCEKLLVDISVVLKDITK